MAIENKDFDTLTKFASKPKKDQIIEPFESPMLENYIEAQQKTEEDETEGKKNFTSIYLEHIGQDILTDDEKE